MGDKDQGVKIVALISNENGAWLRVGRIGDDYPLTKKEVAELSRVFRRCVDAWKRIDTKAGISTF